MGPPCATQVGVVCSSLRGRNDRKPRQRRVSVRAAGEQKDDISTKQGVPAFKKTPDELLRASNWLEVLSASARQAGSLAVIVGNALSETISETSKKRAALGTPAPSRSSPNSSGTPSAAATTFTTGTTVRRTETTQTMTISESAQGQLLVRFRELRL